MGKNLLPNVIRADFVAEVRELAGLPTLGPPEIAIAGRSNVGKSTLLNRLAARRSLARTSKTPGRTRGLLFYDLAVRFPGRDTDRDLSLRLVDLPGYGYARVSQAERQTWQTLVEGYVKRRPTLTLFLVLVDARREPGPEERQLFEWLAIEAVQSHLVVTKVDKLSATERGALGQRFRALIGPTCPPISLVSGQTGEGVDRLWTAIASSLLGAADASSPPKGAP